MPRKIESNASERIRRSDCGLRPLRRHGGQHSDQTGCELPDAECGSRIRLRAQPVNKAVHELPYRGFDKPGRLPHVFQANEFNANQWVDETENPYTHDPANLYNWVRVRLVGGRSLFWARQSFRLSDFEFKAGDIDGTGENWPISLADMAPFYSRVEEIFRVQGRKEGWPQFPDGNFVEPNYGPDSGTIKRLAALGKERGMKFSKMRSSGGQNGLASSVNLLLPDAMATGKLEMVSNAIVREITTDKNTGLANGVHFVDRHSRREMHVKARVVVLAAGTLESTRLLLNSGIANSSGVLGHYLARSDLRRDGGGVRSRSARWQAPEGLMGGSAFMPRFRNLSKAEKRDFIKGYCMLISSGGSANPSSSRSMARSCKRRWITMRAPAFPAAFSASARRVSKTTCGSIRT